MAQDTTLDSGSEGHGAPGSFLPNLLYSLGFSSGSLTSCMLSENGHFLPLNKLSPKRTGRNRSVLALSLGPALRTRSPLVFPRHSAGFSSWDSVYSAPAANSASQSPAPGLVTRAGKCTHQMHSAWVSGRKATPDINILQHRLQKSC